MLGLHTVLSSIVRFHCFQNSYLESKFSDLETDRCDRANLENTCVWGKGGGGGGGGGGAEGGVSRKDVEAEFSRSNYAIPTRGVGWCIILQEQNTSS